MILMRTCAAEVLADDQQGAPWKVMADFQEGTAADVQFIQCKENLAGRPEQDWEHLVILIRSGCRFFFRFMLRKKRREKKRKGIDMERGLGHEMRHR